MTEGIVEIINKTLDILSKNPLAFSIGLFLLVGFSIYIFKDVIGLWLRRVLKVYNEKEIKEALVKTTYIDLNTEYEVLNNLKNKK